MLLLASSVCCLFKWRQFEPEVILLAVGWYLRFSLSYRDVEELLVERGLRADHVTVWRCVQRYAPELDRRLRKRLKATNETTIGTAERYRCKRPLLADIELQIDQCPRPLSGGTIHLCLEKQIQDLVIGRPLRGQHISGYWRHRSRFLML